MPMYLSSGTTIVIVARAFQDVQFSFLNHSVAIKIESYLAKSLDSMRNCKPSMFIDDHIIFHLLFIGDAIVIEN